MLYNLPRAILVHHIQYPIWEIRFICNVDKGTTVSLGADWKDAGVAYYALGNGIPQLWPLSQVLSCISCSNLEYIMSLWLSTYTAFHCSVNVDLIVWDTIPISSSLYRCVWKHCDLVYLEVTHCVWQHSPMQVYSEISSFTFSAYFSYFQEIMHRIATLGCNILFTRKKTHLTINKQWQNMFLIGKPCSLSWIYTLT